jgi:hypothetical protein
MDDSPEIKEKRMLKGRFYYSVFNALNGAGYALQSGNLVLLYAKCLEASSAFIGILGAMPYVGYLFVPLGRLLAARRGVVRIFSSAWISRSVSLLFLVCAPVVYYAGGSKAALGLVAIGVFLFNAFTGIGIIGSMPVSGSLSSGPDRGSFLIRLQIVNIGITMLAGVMVSFFLGRDPPLPLYVILLCAGMGIGIICGVFLSKVPEPGGGASARGMGFLTSFKNCLALPRFGLLMVSLFLTAGISGAARTFLIVYSKDVFDQSDGMVSLYGAAGYLGYVITGLFVKKHIDKKNPIHLLILSGAFGLAGMLLLILLSRPLVSHPVISPVFLFFVFFIIFGGTMNREGILNVYFLKFVPEKYTLDMGMAYFFLCAGSGIVFSFLAGVFLDQCALMGLDPVFFFGLLYAILCVFLCAGIFLQSRLPSLSARS